MFVLIKSRCELSRSMTIGELWAHGTFHEATPTSQLTIQLSMSMGAPASIRQMIRSSLGKTQNLLSKIFSALEGPSISLHSSLVIKLKPTQVSGTSIALVASFNPKPFIHMKLLVRKPREIDLTRSLNTIGIDVCSSPTSFSMVSTMKSGWIMVRRTL